MNKPGPRVKVKKPGPGRPRDAERDLRNDAILAAAAEVFFDQGFARASTDEIARRAGASKQTFYSRYRSKADLFAAVMKRRAEQLTDPIAASVFNKQQSVEETLCTFGIQVLRANLSSDGQRLQKLLLAETSTFPELAQAFWQNGPGYGRELVKRYLESLGKQGVLAINDAANAADHFMSLVFGWVMLRACFHFPTELATGKELATWVKSAVGVFLLAYRPAS